jgi:hypothetical protein
VVLATAYGVLRRKGFVRGSVDIGLDMIPIFGTAKGVVELVTGDLIPDQPGSKTRDARAACRPRTSSLRHLAPLAGDRCEKMY